MLVALYLWQRSVDLLLARVNVDNLISCIKMLPHILRKAKSLIQAAGRKIGAV
ncbi:hypothetical protein D3C78_1078550 [compost metagenome]